MSSLAIQAVPDAASQLDDTSAFAGGKHLVASGAAQCRNGFRQMVRWHLSGARARHELQSIVGQIWITRFGGGKDLQRAPSWLAGLLRRITPIAIGFQLRRSVPRRWARTTALSPAIDPRAIAPMLQFDNGNRACAAAAVAGA